MTRQCPDCMARASSPEPPPVPRTLRSHQGAAARARFPGTRPQSRDDPLIELADLLWEARHRLPADVMRTLGDVLFCSAATRFGEPYEPDLYGAEDYARHCAGCCEEAGEW